MIDDNNEILAVDVNMIDSLFPSTPLHRSVLIECEITAKINLIDDSVSNHADSDFARGIRDVHGLLQDVTLGKHSATVRYVYEDGAPSGYWQLEYID
ncbi:hypothetical protein AAVH_28943 [Aphelenchoides avenae]|nr:hypothetical protein AAVH_28943 [Aphelenchus avenae]